MNPASNLILVGPMGAGKTSIGKRLAQRLQLRFVDADVALESHTGASVNLIFELEGEQGFRQRERALLQQLCEGDGQLIATGGGAVLDPENRRLLARSGFVLYLRVDVDRQLQRLQRDRSRPLLRAPDRRERLQAMAAQREPLYREIADLSYDSEHDSVGHAVDSLLAQLRQHWRRSDTDHAA
jgi:shikimate kinase